MKKRLTLFTEEETIRRFKSIAAYRGISMSQLLYDKLFENPHDEFEIKILNKKIENISK